MIDKRRDLNIRIILIWILLMILILSFVTINIFAKPSNTPNPPDLEIKMLGN